VTPIFSYLPPFHQDPQEVLALVPRNMIACITLRPSYPAWPWAVEELDRTAWRCLHSGSLKLVHRTTERDGQPVLDAQGILGFWADTRFVVEAWLRVDHLPPDTQLSWFGVEITYWRSQVERWTQYPDAWQHAYAPFTACVKNPKTHREALQQARQEVDRALRRARAFAACHKLSVGQDVLNAGIQFAPCPVQMALL
jgi:hypothetical protein